MLTLSSSDTGVIYQKCGHNVLVLQRSG